MINGFYINIRIIEIGNIDNKEKKIFPILREDGTACGFGGCRYSRPENSYSGFWFPVHAGDRPPYSRVLGLFENLSVQDER